MERIGRSLICLDYDVHLLVFVLEVLVKPSSGVFTQIVDDTGAFVFCSSGLVLMRGRPFLNHEAVPAMLGEESSAEALRNFSWKPFCAFLLFNVSKWFGADWASRWLLEHLVEVIDLKKAISWEIFEHYVVSN